MELLNKIQQQIKAPKTQFNKHGGYYYRSCSDILSAVKPFMGNALLHMNDEIVQVGDRYYVKATVTLTHEGKTASAEGFAREAEDQKGMNAGQLSSSTSSYARKVALSGLFAIDDSHDAGGNGNGDAKPMTQTEVAQLMHSIFIDEHRDDIPEHFTIPLDTFKAAMVKEAKAQIKPADRKTFVWTEESVKPFVAKLKLEDLLKEENANLPS